MNAIHLQSATAAFGNGDAARRAVPAARDGAGFAPQRPYLALVVTAKPGSQVEIRPEAVAARQATTWRGIAGEVVRIDEGKALECDYCGPSHLLIAYHRALRSRGDTALDDLPRSTLHDLNRKLTFVPAGSRFRERHEPDGPMQLAFFYIDPGGARIDAGPGRSPVTLMPRMFFEDRALWETSLKLTQLIEAGPSACCRYAEALGVVLTQELLLLANPQTPTGLALQGGLANWQQRAVTQFIEKNLGNHVSLTELANIARLSPYHFSRAFKKSFGIPPHRYHMNRRIDWAKRLLSQPHLSVTEIALNVGFADTSSFSVAFRNLVGRPPREYRRSLF